MRVSIVASRYSKALFELAEEKKTSTQVFEQARILQEALFSEESHRQILSSKLVSSENKLSLLKKVFQGQKIDSDLENLIYLLAERDRLGILPEIVAGFQSKLDHSLGVARGEVRSATPLGPEERERLEKMIHQAIGKKVVLTYKQDPTVIGGLVAQVGSYTFDDSLESHLRRLNEELKRRAH